MTPSITHAFVLIILPTVGDVTDDTPNPQDTSVEQRLKTLEDENTELRRRIDIVADEMERFELGSIAPPVGESEHGFGPAASKIYGAEQGLSIGGYGEALYENFAGSAKSDQFDFLRAILYVGYKFNEHWVFNSEIEIEHASTGKSGDVSVEFAYIDRMWREAINFRVGLLLVPMGFINELHEPTTFLTARRPVTETKIIPSTWRENGAGLFGDLGPFSYRAYVLTGLDGSGFSADGLRGGRQKGSKALADDFAVVGRLDWTATPGLTIGGSVYYGDSGQEQTGPGGALPDTTTTIADLHAEWQQHGWWIRGLATMADVDDAAELNAALGLTGSDSVGEELEGWYVEAGYDLLSWLAPGSRQALTPHVRFEDYDTQSDVPSSFSTKRSSDEEVVTLGLNWKPIDQLVFKLDYQDFEQGTDQWSLALGYIF